MSSLFTYLALQGQASPTSTPQPRRPAQGGEDQDHSGAQRPRERAGLEAGSILLQRQVHLPVLALPESAHFRYPGRDPQDRRPQAASDKFSIRGGEQSAHPFGVKGPPKPPGTSLRSKRNTGREGSLGRAQRPRACTGEKQKNASTL